MCLKISVIVIPEYLHKAFDIRASSALYNARRLTLCYLRYELKAPSLCACNLSHKREHFARRNIVSDSILDFIEAHTKWQSICYWRCFLCVFDWKIRVLVVLRFNQTYRQKSKCFFALMRLERFDSSRPSRLFTVFVISRSNSILESLRRMFIHGETMRSISFAFSSNVQTL